MYRIISTIANPRPPPRTRLHFSDDELKRIKKAAEQRRGDWVSTNDALLAHIYDVLLDTFQLPDEQREHLAVCVLANLRGRAGISNRFFGNAVSKSICPVDFRRNVIGESQGVDLASVVHDSLRAQMTETRLFMFVELLSWVSRQVLLVSSGVVFVSMQMPQVPGMLTRWNNSTSYPINKVDFGAGPPVRSINQNDGEAIRVVPCPAGGVDILVSHARSGIGGWRALMPWSTWAMGPITNWAQLSLWSLILMVFSVIITLDTLACGSGFNGLFWVSCAVGAATYVLRVIVNRHTQMADFFEALPKNARLHMYAAPLADATTMNSLDGNISSKQKVSNSL